jgi:transcriptional regulator with XRE-family HTH domain
MSNQSSQFSDRLRRAREERGLSQAQLGEKAGLQAAAISHFENGRRSPSFDNLRALADALNIATDDLLGRTTKTTATGPVAERLFRKASKLTDRDLELLAEFADTLGKRNPTNEG